MKKKELKKEYDKLVAEIEGAEMFDGRGLGVDVYVCEKCGKQFYTRYKDKGVTPYTIQCRREDCKAAMIHRATISEVQAKNDGLVVHNWVRPTFEQFLKLNKGAQEHVLIGALMLEDELNEKHGNDSMVARWHKFPDEKPSVTGEYLVRGIGGLNDKLHHWVCLWVEECEDPRIAHRFFYGGNEFNNVPSGQFEWMDLKEL